MGRESSLRSKAAHFVSDLTTVILNPISDKPSKQPPQPSSPDDTADVKGSGLSSAEEKEGSENVADGPDTSSFSAFLRSLLVPSESGNSSILEEKIEGEPEGGEDTIDGIMKESRGRRSLISKGKQSVGRIISHAARFTGCRSQGLERRSNGDVDECKSRPDGVEMKAAHVEANHVITNNLPATSEISMLLSVKTRSALYASLPALVQGRKWVMLYSTWKHGISLSTLYRRSMLWPGLSLLVVGDRKGAIFGGLLEAPLRPSSMRRYQGSNSSFVFSNTSGHPVVYRPTGVNRYYTVCAMEYLALGGGGHFALYLDEDLLTGSSVVSETYGNPCLAHTADFEVKEVELWGFVYASKFDEVVDMSHAEAPGICRW